MPAITAQLLAFLLVEELDRDDWSDIDLEWLEQVARGQCNDPAFGQAGALAQVLDRVAARLNTVTPAEKCGHPGCGGSITALVCDDCRSY